MCDDLLILGKYDDSSGSVFILNYNSIPEGLSGTELSQVYYNVPLLSVYDNSEIGTVKFIDNTETTLTNPKKYSIIENITININNYGTVYGNNYFVNEGSYDYNIGDKLIIPITSCTGTFVGKKGYIVIDVTKDTRYITIRLDN